MTSTLDTVRGKPHPAAAPTRRRGERDALARPRRPDRAARAAARRARGDGRPVHLDGALVVQARGGDPRGPADVLAANARPRAPTTCCSTGWTSRPTSRTRSWSRSSRPLGNLLFCSAAGYALAKLTFPGKRRAVPRGARHDHGAERRDDGAAVRAVQQPRPGQLARRADPAVPRAGVRRVPDAPVHHVHSGRPARGRSHRRRGRAADLLADRASAVPPGARDARHPHVPGVVEQLPVAARRGLHGGQLHAAGRARPVRHRAEPDEATTCCWPARS